MSFFSIYFLFSILLLSIHWVAIPWLGLAFEAASFIPGHRQNASQAPTALTPTALVPGVASSVGAGSPSCPLRGGECSSQAVLALVPGTWYLAGTLRGAASRCLWLETPERCPQALRLGGGDGESSTSSWHWLTGGPGAPRCRLLGGSSCLRAAVGASAAAANQRWTRLGVRWALRRPGSEGCCAWPNWRGGERDGGQASPPPGASPTAGTAAWAPAVASRTPDPAQLSLSWRLPG